MNKSVLKTSFKEGKKLTAEITGRCFQFLRKDERSLQILHLAVYTVLYTILFEAVYMSFTFYFFF